MSHLETRSAIGRQLAREQYREQTGQGQVEARAARVEARAAKIEEARARGRARARAEVEAQTGQGQARARVARVARSKRVEAMSASEREVAGYRLLSPAGLSAIVSTVEGIAWTYPGLDTGQVVSLALARVARSLVTYPLNRSTWVEAMSMREPGDREPFGSWVEGRLRARSNRAAHRVARKLKTGRGSMPFLVEGEREQGSPNWATWHGLIAGLRVDSRCWCSAADECQAHRVEVEGRQVYGRQVEVVMGPGKAVDRMRWLATHYREPGTVSLLAASAVVNSRLDHLALIAAVGDTWARSTRAGRYLGSRVDLNSARARFNRATGRTESWHTFAERVERAANRARYRRAKFGQVERSIGPALIEVRQVEGRRVEPHSQPDTLRVEIGPRAWHALARVDRSRVEARQVEARAIKSRVEAYEQARARFDQMVESRGHSMA